MLGKWIWLNLRQCPRIFLKGLKKNKIFGQDVNYTIFVLCFLPQKKISTEKIANLQQLFSYTMWYIYLKSHLSDVTLNVDIRSFINNYTSNVSNCVCTSHNASAISITMCCMIDASASQVISFFITEIPLVAWIKDSKSIDWSRANRKHLSFCTRAIAINIVEARTLWK
jgi:hypothetical protein